MHISVRLTLVFAFFIGISVGYARPSAAAGIPVIDVTVWKALGTVIMGVPPETPRPGPYKRQVPGEVKGMDEEILTEEMPISLVDYYEKVWWPRMVELTKAQQGAQDKTSTLLNELQGRTEQARAYSDYTQDVRRMTVENQAKALGRADLLCSEPSMFQSSLALQEVARARLRAAQRQSTQEMAGDKSLRAYATGGVGYAQAVHKWRKQNGVCTKNGSNGTASKYCTNTVAGIENADETVATLTGTFVYDGAQLQNTDGGAPSNLTPNHVSLVKRFIDNVFVSRIFEPLPTSITEQDPLPPDAVQIIADQAAYASAMTTFQNPFLQEQADRTPVEGVEALNSLSAELDRAGYEGAAKELFIKDGKTSRAAQEYIIFKVYQTDPKTVSDDIAALGGMSVENLMQESILKQMMQMTLMYDIREQIKQTNLILGAIGAVLSEPQYRNLRERIQAVQGPQDRPH